MHNLHQETIKVPLPPHQVFVSLKFYIQKQKSHSNFHISHDLPCHENPRNNLPFDNLKHRRKDKYLATFQEVAFWIVSLWLSSLFFKYASCNNSLSSNKWFLSKIKNMKLPLIVAHFSLNIVHVFKEGCFLQWSSSPTRIWH